MEIIFQDNNYAYLISDKCIGSYTPSGYYRSYTNGSFVSTIGQKIESQNKFTIYRIKYE